MSATSKTHKSPSSTQKTQSPFISKPTSIIIYIFCLLLSDVCTAEENLILKGKHKFAIGDNISWTSPQLDDSHWADIEIPSSWQSQGFKSTSGMAWYRVHFDSNNLTAHKPLGVYLGKIGDADEVFLNGVKIGSQGLIGEDFVEATTTLRLYKIPENVLNSSSDNVLAIRVQNTYLKGGLFDSAIVIGNYNELLLNLLNEIHNRKIVELILMTIYSVVIVFCVFMYISGVRDKGYLAFSAVCVLYAICYFLNMQLLHQYKTPIMQRVIYFLTALLPAGFLIFSAFTFNVKLSGFAKGVIVGICILAVAFLFPSQVRILKLKTVLWSSLTVLSAVLCLKYSLRAVRAKQSDAIIYLTGLSVIALGAIYWIAELHELLPPHVIFEHSPADFAMPIAMLCFIYAVDKRFSRTLKDTRRFAEMTLTAYEDERKRVARDLHDTVGQSLVSIKLRLQMLKSRLTESQHTSALQQIIDHVSVCIAELKEVAMNIRPAFLEKIDIVEATKLHVKRLIEKTDCDIEVTAQGDFLLLDDKVKDNLYRIIQEALTNVLKHAEATEVKIHFELKDEKLILSIKDNGKGFDTSNRRALHGLGLLTIKERSELINAKCDIKSSLETGTEITLKVPYKTNA